MIRVSAAHVAAGTESGGPEPMRPSSARSCRDRLGTSEVNSGGTARSTKKTNARVKVQALGADVRADVRTTSAPASRPLPAPSLGHFAALPWPLPGRALATPRPLPWTPTVPFPGHPPSTLRPRQGHSPAPTMRPRRRALVVVAENVHHHPGRHGTLRRRDGGRVGVLRARRPAGLALSRRSGPQASPRGDNEPYEPL